MRTYAPVEFVRSLYFLGQINEKQGNHDKAREDYGRFLQKSGCSFTAATARVANGNVGGVNAQTACSYTVSGKFGTGSATVSLNGKSTASDANGNYSISGIANGTHKRKPLGLLSSCTTR